MRTPLLPSCTILHLWWSSLVWPPPPFLPLSPPRVQVLTLTTTAVYRLLADALFAFFFFSSDDYVYGFDPHESSGIPFVD